jgi:hypothetical protein
LEGTASEQIQVFSPEAEVSPDGADLEPSGRRDMARLHAALALVRALAGLEVEAPDATREDGRVDLGAALEARAQRVRAGKASAEEAASEYLLRTAPGRSREAFTRIVEVAARAAAEKRRWIRSADYAFRLLPSARPRPASYLT